ncbi:MAG TPA: hypothetical protein VFF65_12865 [Phycisphaerales bacterium]|nr:hypothetical protein [Phycisphaerales bacterium]
MGHGPNALLVEDSLANSKPQLGYAEDFAIPLTACRLLNGANLGSTAGAPPYFAQPDNVSFPLLHVIQWRQDADATNRVVFNFKVPGQYNPASDKLLVIASLRKADADNVDENPDLSFQVDMNWHRPGWCDPAAAAGAVPTFKRLSGGTFALAAPVTRRFAYIVIPTVKDWLDYQFNLNKGLGRSATQTIQPHDELAISIGPNETVGDTNMTVDMKGLVVRWFRGASLHNEDSRTNSNMIRALK